MLDLRALAVALTVSADELVFDPEERGPKTSPCDSTLLRSTSSTPTNGQASALSSKVHCCATKHGGSRKPADYAARLMNCAGTVSASQTSSLPS